MTAFRKWGKGSGKWEGEGVGGGGVCAGLFFSPYLQLSPYSKLYAVYIHTVTVTYYTILCTCSFFSFLFFSFRGQVAGMTWCVVKLGLGT